MLLKVLANALISKTKLFIAFVYLHCTSTYLFCCKIELNKNKNQTKE